MNNILPFFCFLQHDATKWLQENVDTISSDGVLDNILDEITKLSNVLNLVVTHCTPVNVISTFFAIFGVNYYQKISVFVDSKVRLQTFSHSCINPYI